MPIPFLPSVDLTKGPSGSKEGLTRKQLSYLGCVFFITTPNSIETLFQFLQRHTSVEAYVDVTAIELQEDIVSILDAGARKVFVKAAQLESLQVYGDRVLPAFSSADQTLSTATYTNGVLINTESDESITRPILEKLSASKTSPVFLTSTRANSHVLLELSTDFSAIPIIPAAQLTVEDATSGQISVPELIGGSWTSDRTDKLVPTVVTDERGISLGLVYSSQESLAESLKTGTGVYQSRKRGLWYKGATSGDTQELVQVSLDCDQDCLKFVVRQKGRGTFFSL